MANEPLDLPPLSGGMPCSAASGRRTLSVLSGVPSRCTSFSTVAPASPSHLFLLCLSVRTFVRLFVCLSVCLPVCLSVYPSPPPPPPRCMSLSIYACYDESVRKCMLSVFSPNLCAVDLHRFFREGSVLRTVTTLLTDCNCKWQTYG